MRIEKTEPNSGGILEARSMEEILCDTMWVKGLLEPTEVGGIMWGAVYHEGSKEVLWAYHTVGGVACSHHLHPAVMSHRRKDCDLKVPEEIIFLAKMSLISHKVLDGRAIIGGERAVPLRKKRRHNATEG